MDKDSRTVTQGCFDELITIGNKRGHAPGTIQAGDDIDTLPSISPLKPTVVFNTYWKFAAERQRIFFARCRSNQGPWTDDPILRDFKFTNVYRASDRVSQYLINNILRIGDQSPAEVFFRTLIFKVFNRIDTWERLERALGYVSFSEFNFRQYDKILTTAMYEGNPVYSAAYIMPSGGKNSEFTRKHQMHLRMIEKMIRDDLPLRLTDCRNMEEAFTLVRNYPTIGDFLAYQYITDLNYGPLLDFSEMQFVCAGPGAKSGIRKCFTDTGGLNEAEIIRFMADRQEEEFTRLGIDFKDLWGRRLQLIDCQNLFCEVDKYSRVAHPEFSGPSGRVRIKQKFKPATKEIAYRFPDKWNINTQTEPPT